MTRIIGEIVRQNSDDIVIERNNIPQRKKIKKPNVVIEEYKRIMKSIEDKKEEVNTKNSERVIGCFRDQKDQDLRDFVKNKKDGKVLTASLGDIIKYKEKNVNNEMQEEA